MDVLDLHGILFSGAVAGQRVDGCLHPRRKGRALSQDRTFLLLVSLGLLLVAVVLNIIGLNIGKWLQNAGGVGTYLPLMMLVGVARGWSISSTGP